MLKYRLASIHAFLALRPSRPTTTPFFAPSTSTLAWNEPSNLSDILISVIYFSFKIFFKSFIGSSLYSTSSTFLSILFWSPNFSADQTSDSEKISVLRLWGLSLLVSRERASRLSCRGQYELPTGIARTGARYTFYVSILTEKTCFRAEGAFRSTKNRILGLEKSRFCVIAFVWLFESLDEACVINFRSSKRIGLCPCFEEPRFHFLWVCSHGKWSSQVHFRSDI